MDGNLVRTFKNEDSFSNMCRVCLAWNGDSMPSIFDSIKSDKSVPIIEVINNLTNISIKEGDGLPERICDACLIATERILEFKHLCEQTDSNLRKFLLALNGKNGAKSTNCEVEKADSLSNSDETSVYSRISERIRVESEVMIVDPSCSIYDENQNQSDVHCEEQTTNHQVEEEWSGGDPPSASGHTVFDWESGDQASEFVSSSYDAVETFTYDKLAEASDNYMPVQTVDSGSEDEVQLKTFKCRTCHKAFHTQKWLERHSQLHDETQPYPCDYCFRSYSAMSDLVAHWREHADGRDFCRLCGEPFADAAQQRRHFAQHAAAVDDPQPNCNKCLQGFSDVTDMQKHMADSHPGRNVAASTEASCDSSENRCSVCKKQFGRRSNLMKHMLALHSGFRPHRCSTCRKTFASKADLARHTSTHTGERPHTCNVCLYSFSRRDKLVRHMRTHSSERPYSCELCATRFKWKDKLLRHMRSTHPEHDSMTALAQLQLYKCKQCPQSYRTRLELSTHLQQHLHFLQQPVVFLNRIEDGSEPATAVANES